MQLYNLAENVVIAAKRTGFLFFFKQERVNIVFTRLAAVKLRHRKRLLGLQLRRRRNTVDLPVQRSDVIIVFQRFFRVFVFYERLHQKHAEFLCGGI